LGGAGSNSGPGLVVADLRRGARAWLTARGRILIPHGDVPNDEAEEATELQYGSHIITESGDEEDEGTYLNATLDSDPWRTSTTGGRKVSTKIKAHTLAWLLNFYSEPELLAAECARLANKDLVICHLCGCGDVGCVTPSHLVLASKSANYAHERYHFALRQCTPGQYRNMVTVFQTFRYGAGIL